MQICIIACARHRNRKTPTTLCIMFYFLTPGPPLGVCGLVNGGGWGKCVFFCGNMEVKLRGKNLKISHHGKIMFEQCGFLRKSYKTYNFFFFQTPNNARVATEVKMDNSKPWCINKPLTRCTSAPGRQTPSHMNRNMYSHCKAKLMAF